MRAIPAIELLTRVKPGQRLSINLPAAIIPQLVQQAKDRGLIGEEFILHVDDLGGGFTQVRRPASAPPLVKDAS